MSECRFLLSCENGPTHTERRWLRRVSASYGFTANMFSVCYPPLKFAFPLICPLALWYLTGRVIFGAPLKGWSPVSKWLMALAQLLLSLFPVSGSLWLLKLSGSCLPGNQYILIWACVCVCVCIFMMSGSSADFYSYKERWANFLCLFYEL